MDVALDRVLTPRLTGTVAYEYRFFDFKGRLENTITHTPRLGASYRFTETITGTVSAGPTLESDGTSRTTPAVTASLSQRYGWGTLGVDYSRAVGTAGGLGRHRQQPIGRRHRAAHVVAAATGRAGRAPLHLVGVA